ncbi:MAG: hypothetical protein O6943_06270 [Bacteroidetes bacterium]|nr:hypothetical protein [Bacteroidota bacterium]
MNEKKDSETTKDSIILRLDALIRLLIETNKDKEGFNDAHFSRILHSVGISPTEIARILGKKKATDISPYLYGKKKK